MIGALFLAASLWTSSGLPICGAITPDARGVVNLCVQSAGASAWSCASNAGDCAVGVTPPAGTSKRWTYWPATIFEQRELCAGISIPIVGRTEAAFAPPSASSAPLVLGLESSPGILAISRARRIAAGKPVP